MISVIPSARKREARVLRITGNIRIDKKTKNLAKRVRPGEIAVIDHQDIDGISAEMLVGRRVAAVVNAASSISGKYPNSGPGILLRAGIPLIDMPDQPLFKHLREGEAIEIQDGALFRKGKQLFQGEALTAKKVEDRMEAAKLNLGVELERFAENTLSYVIKEKSLLVDPTNLPHVDTALSGRHVLIVVRGDGYKEDLAIIRTYLRDVKPVLIGVDGGADALLELGFRPDIIVGDMDSVSDRALKCGAEIIVHAYTDESKHSPGLERVQRLGVEAKAIAAPGTSEDLAMLLAYEKGAELIVAVGTHSHLVDFLDKGRRGMSSTFLVRLKIGSRLVDAKGVSKIYSRRPLALRDLLLISAAAALALLALVVFVPSATETLRAAYDSMAGDVRLLTLRLRAALLRPL